MDYAFAPGLEFGDLRTVLGRRSNTTVILDPGVTTISGFLNYLQAHSLTGGDFVIGSHGTDEGQLLIALDPAVLAAADPTHGPQTVFETLQTHNTITIPSSIRTADTSVRLFGCLIGSAECLPFLTLLKQRFGNPKKLTAPRFVHTTHSIDGVNFFEFMKYDFRILRKDHFNSRQELLDAFKNGGFQYFFDTPGSSTIPPDNWDAWLPLSPALVPRINPSTSNELSLPFGATISPAVDGVDALIIDMASWDSVLEQYTENGIPMNRAVPTDPAGLVAFVEEAFGKDPAFQTSHPYPIHKRFHNVSLHDFAAGW
ncbi:MAG TPA: hypothetical protein VGO27_05935, partial [Candidatus Acidoferrum sp.]|nr:hypothetical protein [Candidatus Acidoferrum sp.]